MTEDEDTRQSELQNVEKGGTPARRRIASPGAAYNIYQRLKELDVSDSKRRATLQGMINGNPPYNPQELKDKGLAHMCNVNFMSMRANLDSRAQSAHELLMEVPTLVELKPRKAVQLNPEVYHWCSIVSEEFTRMVQDWDGFTTAMDLAIRESDAYGIGYVLFPDKWDWRFKAARRGALLFDPKASVDVDRNDLIMIRDEMTASELFTEIEDSEPEDKESPAYKVGWNVQAVREYLVRIFREGETNETEYQTSMWESLQHAVRNNDPMFQEKQFERVRVVHVLVRENTAGRKVSHYIMPDNDLDKSFLFEDNDAYDNMSEAIWWLPYNYGDGYARSVRGVASLMAQHDDLSNRFLCEIFNLGFLSTKMMLQPTNAGDLGKLQFMQHGSFAVLPPNLQAVQTSFRPQIAPLIQLRDVSEKVMMNKSGSYKQHSESIEREANKTARQVMEEVSKEARFERAAVAHRYSRLDRLYREMFRRIFNKETRSGEADYPGKKQAEEMVKRCQERGVETKFINNVMEEVSIMATRAIGMGSTSVKMDITNQLVQASSMFDEQGRREALRDWTSARVGYANADKYVQRMDRDQIASDAASMATLEWNDVTEGHQILAASDQLPKPHIGVFMQGIAGIVQQFEQGQLSDPVTAFRTMQLGLQHIGQHVQFIAQDPRYADFLKGVQQFAQVATQAMGQIEQQAKRVAQMQAQQQAQQQETVANAERVVQDREIELKILQAQQRYELDRMTKESMNAMRERKAEDQIATRRESTAAGVRLNAEKQAAEIAIAQSKAAAEIAIKQAKGMA